MIYAYRRKNSGGFNVMTLDANPADVLLNKGEVKTVRKEVCAALAATTHGTVLFVVKGGKHE